MSMLCKAAVCRTCSSGCSFEAMISDAHGVLGKVTFGTTASSDQAVKPTTFRLALI